MKEYKKEEVIDKNLKIFEEGGKYLMPTYGRFPVVFTKAKMQYLWDANGERYTDFIAGYGCLNVGHSNKFIVNSLKKQIGKIIQPSNVYYNEPQIELAKKLCEITGFGKKVFFANSGTEAIEGAIKLARKYSRENISPLKFKIISFYKSFHGRTMGALSATAQEEKQKVFEPMLEGFGYAKINDINSVKEKIDENTCAILIEPIQGEGGINVSEKDFIIELRKICDKEKILLILDEVQTGFGRTGKMFAFQNYSVIPDILVVAKSLGGGMPIGAIISDNKISSVFTPGSHGSTFGGNAASTVSGCAVIDYILKNHLPEKAEKLGKYLINCLMKLKNKYPVIKDIRGMGLMIGMEFNKPIADRLVREALKSHLVINKVSDMTLRFLPPLIITKSDLDILVKWLDGMLKAENHQGDLQ
ncbi:MAG: aspartate aminotransferase family protein [Actinobacteria bacterium]|nr:aspartate aminotransferase family protein [Actinomycetota bacterium]